MMLPNNISLEPSVVRILMVSKLVAGMHGTNGGLSNLPNLNALVKFSRLGIGAGRFKRERGFPASARVLPCSAIVPSEGELPSLGNEWSVFPSFFLFYPLPIIIFPFQYLDQPFDLSKWQGQASVSGPRAVVLGVAEHMHLFCRAS